jgi:hypothetical protein
MIVADVLPPKTLADVGDLINRHLPAEVERNTWRRVAQQLTEAAHGVDAFGLADLLLWAVSDTAISADPP